MDYRGGLKKELPGACWWPRSEPRWVTMVGRAQLRGGVGAAIMPITIITTIAPTGSITITTEDPEDFEKVRDHIMSMVAAIAGDNPIAYGDCLDPNEEDGIARRLANMILAEVA
jgi:hypothetical protein